MSFQLLMPTVPCWHCTCRKRDRIRPI